MDSDHLLPLPLVENDKWVNGEGIGTCEREELRDYRETDNQRELSSEYPSPSFNISSS